MDRVEHGHAEQRGARRNVVSAEAVSAGRDVLIELRVVERQCSVRMITYLLGAQVDGRTMVKIGKAKNVLRRVSLLQTGSPVKLTILACARGDFESELHRAFAKDRSHGEWFECSEVLADVIARMQTAAGLHLETSE